MFKRKKEAEGFAQPFSCSEKKEEMFLFLRMGKRGGGEERKKTFDWRKKERSKIISHS